MFSLKQTAILIFFWVLVIVSVNKLLGFSSTTINNLLIFLLGGLCTLLIYLTIKNCTSFFLREKSFHKYKILNSIFNNLPFIIYLADRNGKILFANKYFSKALNINSEKLIGRNISAIYKSNLQNDIKNLCIGKKIIKEEFLEFCNGEKHWFKISQTPIMDYVGKLSEIMVFLINIDMDKQTEENKDTFLATLIHDLKTPTIAQLQASELLLNERFGQLNDEQKEIISQMKNSCQYMRELIFTVLDTYLYDNGQTKIKPEEFDIVELVAQTANDLSYLLDEKGQKININSSSKIVYAIADKFQIKRVVVNFLSNAIQHGFKNSTINIDISDKNANVILNIKNKATYIPKKDIKELFVKFKQKGTNVCKTGTGLGLYLSKQIITAHNGKVYAKSSCNEVCDFGFELPKKNNYYSNCIKKAV